MKRIVPGSRSNIRGAKEPLALPSVPRNGIVDGSVAMSSQMTRRQAAFDYDDVQRTGILAINE